MTLAPVSYAVIAGISFGLWIVFHKLASPHISQLLGAVLVSAFAISIGLALMASKGFSSADLSYTTLGVIFIFLAGACALGLDIFTLKAFSSGPSVSIGGPIIVGLSTAIPAILGILFLGESFSWVKLGALAFILIGTITLASVE